jgi:hypothetical protein
VREERGAEEYEEDVDARRDDRGKDEGENGALRRKKKKIEGGFGQYI